VPGEFDLPVIKAFVTAMHASGEFNTADMPVDTLFSNALVPAFSRFDKAGVQAQAKAAK